MKLLVISAIFAVAVGAQAVTLSLDPKATYLRTNNDPSTNAVAYKISDLGIGAGDLVKFTRVGSFNNGNNTDLYGLTAVFSSSSTLLASNQLNRVPGALDAGTDWATAVTFNGSLATDIAEDFAIANNGQQFLSATVIVPVAAEYIFFSAQDSYYGDNTSSTFGVEVEAVPEPGTLAALGLGLAALKRRRK